jgi:hypothetical protein
MINFDALPTTNEYSLEADVYLAHIEKAEMRTPKTPGKPDYLSLQYRLTRHNGKKAGVMFDAQYDSDKQLMQYKLGRFLKACKIPLKGQMELKDIATLVLNKDIVVDAVIDESGNQPRLQADLFGREVYYPTEQFDEIWSLAHPENNEFMPVPEGDDPFTESTEDGDIEY